MITRRVNVSNWKYHIWNEIDIQYMYRLKCDNHNRCRPRSYLCWRYCSWSNCCDLLYRWPWSRGPVIVPDTTYTPTPSPYNNRSPGPCFTKWIPKNIYRCIYTLKLDHVHVYDAHSSGNASMRGESLENVTWMSVYRFCYNQSIIPVSLF